LEDSVAMKSVFLLSLKEIESVLKREKSITDVTKVASNSVSSYSRIKSTEIHDKALEFAMSRHGNKQIAD
jgi:hypothetical protein